MRGGWQFLQRLTHFSLVLSRYALVVGGGGLLRRLPGIGRRMPEPMPGPQRFRALLEDLGGTFIKFGQVLALQPDVLPREYCDELFDLMDRVPPLLGDDDWDAVVESQRQMRGRPLHLTLHHDGRLLHRVSGETPH